MDIQLSDSAIAVARLHEAGYYDGWTATDRSPITFHVHPDAKISEGWMDKRVQAYVENAQLLKLETPNIDFYVYPSIDYAANEGVIATFAIPSKNEVHGHFFQSKGHEVTHILLGQLINPHTWPWSGLWPEGICVLLDRENPDPVMRFLAKDYTTAAFETRWSQWRQWLPDEYYPLAANILGFLVQRYDWDRVKKFLLKLDSTKPDDNEAARAAFDSNIDSLQHEWGIWRKNLRPVENS